MTTSQMHTFLTVCRCLSFTEAAASLNLTQSAVSRQISGLENELGIRLFERNNNILRLTAAGERIRDGFVEITHSIETVIGEARRISGGFQGALRVGQLADQVISRELGNAIRSLSQTGDVEVTVTRLEFGNLYQKFREGELDVVDTIGKIEGVAGDYEALVYQKSQPLFLVARRELIGELPVNVTKHWLTQLSHRVPLCLPEDFRQPPRPFPNDDILGVPVTYRNFDSIVLMTSAGLCASVTNRDNILARDPNIAQVELPFAAPASRCLFWHRDNRNPMIPALISLVKEEIGMSE